MLLIPPKVFPTLSHSIMSPPNALLCETHNGNGSKSHSESPAGLRSPVSRAYLSLSVIILLRPLGGESNQRVDKNLCSSFTHR